MSAQVSASDASNGSLNGTHDEPRPKDPAPASTSDAAEAAEGLKEEVGKVWTGASLFGSSAPPPPRTPSPVNAPAPSSLLASPTPNPPPALHEAPALVPDFSPASVLRTSQDPAMDAPKESEQADDSDPPDSLGDEDSMLLQQPPEEDSNPPEESAPPEDMDLKEDSNLVQAISESPEEPEEKEGEKDEDSEEQEEEEREEGEAVESVNKEAESADDSEVSLKQPAETADSPISQAKEAEEDEGEEQTEEEEEAVPEAQDSLHASKASDAVEEKGEEEEGEGEEVPDESEIAEDSNTGTEKMEIAEESGDGESSEPGAKAEAAADGEEVEEEAKATDETSTPVAEKPGRKMTKKESARKAVEARKAKRLAREAEEEEANEDEPMDTAQTVTTEEVEEKDEETPSRRSSRRSQAAPSAKTTPVLKGTPTTKRKKRGKDESETKEEPEEAPMDTSQHAEEEEDKAEETPVRRGSRRSLATPAQKPAPTPKRGKRKHSEQEEEEEEGEGRGRRSSRNRRPSHLAKEASEERTSSKSATPQPQKRPRRAAAHPPASEPRRSTRAAPSPAAKAPRAPATAPRPAKRAKKSKDDPFDYDNHADESPEPLKNITVDRHQHGSVTFTTSSASKSGASKFSFTETAAAMRKSGTGTPSLSSTLPLTTGKSTGTPARSGAKGTPKGRTPKGSAAKMGSATLFNDIEDRLGDDDEDDDTQPPTPEEVDFTPVRAKAGRKSGAKATPVSSAKKKGGVVVPTLSEEEQLAADDPANISVSHLAPGARVLAKWPGDKCFYAAWVVESAGIGAFRIKFWDGAVRQAPAPDIVPIGLLHHPQVLMKTLDDDDELQPIRIEEPPSYTDAKEWKSGLFTVFNEATEETEKVHWEKMMIDKEQTKDFVSSNINKLAQDVTAENISSSRKRESRGRPAPEVVEEVERTPRTPRSGRRVGAAAGRAAAPAPPMPQPQLDEEEDQGPDFFSGLHFVLTSANRRPKGDAGEEEAGQPPFNKKAVRVTIEDRGGTVVEDFSSEPVPKMFLVADTHYRTHKYLSALARAVPCVNHTWILDSVAQDQLLEHKNYMLPAGVSLEKNTIIDWHDECPGLLKGCTVLVHTENRPSNPSALDFVQIWSPLVECMGARLVSDVESSGGVLDILLTDASCAGTTLEAARAAGAVAVSSEWLIQAIITGTRPDADAHPKYHYGFVETLASPK